MTDINRLQQLAGRNRQQDTINALEQEAKALQESYTVTIDALKHGRQLDEGLFSNLTAALKTATQIGKNGAEAVAAKAKKIGSQIKNIYLDKKAQLELKKMVVSMQKVVSTFDKIETDSPTILSKDTEVKKAFTVFRDIFAKTLEMLTARAAVQEGIELTPAAIEKFLAEQVVIAKGLNKPIEVNIDNDKLTVTYVCKTGEDLMKVTAAVAHNIN